MHRENSENCDSTLEYSQINIRYHFAHIRFYSVCIQGAHSVYHVQLRCQLSLCIGLSSSPIRDNVQNGVCENMVLRRIFVSERTRVAGEWRNQCNAELHSTHSSPTIVWGLKSKST
jgi:hypothetical protein